MSDTETREDEGMTLTEFLSARIAEREADARHSGADAMTGYRWKHYPRDAYEEIQALALSRARRVLAECEAMRRIVELHSAESGQHPDFCGHDLRELPCPTLRFLALPDADHPDYQPEWKP